MMLKYGKTNDFYVVFTFMTTRKDVFLPSLNYRLNNNNNSEHLHYISNLIIKFKLPDCHARRINHTRMRVA